MPDITEKNQSQAFIENIVFFFYDIIFFAGLIVYLPVYFWRKKITFAALKEKLGFTDTKPAPPPGKKCIWIQAVSVGEVNLLDGLLKQLKEYGDYEIIISATTLTGNRLAKKRYPGRAKIIFFPFDISFAIRHVIKTFNLKIFIAVETEIWPNLFFRLSRKNIPIAIINARISDKAINRYKRFKFIVQYALKECAIVAVQNEEYRQRFIDLGCPESKIKITGNMKFDNINLDNNTLTKVKVKYSGIIAPPGNIVLIAASTHCPEEEYALRAYKEIRKKRSDIKLIIAPRHIERTPEIEKLKIAEGLKPLRLSAAKKNEVNNDTVFLLDTIGELLYFYALSDICFVGGSLVKHGGQNILEPISLGKPTIFGPFMDNFSDIAEIVHAEKAGIQVRDTEELTSKLILLINDKDEREKLQKNCAKVFREQTGATENNVKLIISCLNLD